MFKAPVEGMVMTRLAKSVGSRKALALYRWLGAWQLSVVPDGWDLETRFSPDDAESEMRKWLGERPALIAQGGGDLGDRMGRAARESFEDSERRKLIFLGADCPSIDETLLVDAAARLDDADFVLGPSKDGGYYLIGMKGFAKEIFEGVAWSSDEVLKTTINWIQALGMTYQLLPEKEDIDELDSLHSQKEFIDRAVWELLGLEEKGWQPN